MGVVSTIFPLSVVHLLFGEQILVLFLRWKVKISRNEQELLLPCGLLLCIIIRASFRIEDGSHSFISLFYSSRIVK